MPFCPDCGAEHDPDARYCPSCGEPLGADTADSTQPEQPTSNQGWSRRRVLVGVGGIVVVGGGIAALDAGVFDTSPQHRHIDGEAWSMDTQTNQRIEGSVTLAAGRYAAVPLSPPQAIEVTIDFDVGGDTPIDVFTVDDGEYDRYRERESDTQSLTNLTATQTSEGVLEGGLTAGEYKIVFDNTGVYGATPDGEVVVAFTIRGEV